MRVFHSEIYGCIMPRYLLYLSGIAHIYTIEMIGIILAIIFFIATVLLTLAVIKRKEPVWAHYTEKIIGLGTNSPPELKITFNDKEVDQVYSTNIIFYNKGRETIRSVDITQPISIFLNKSQILSEPIIQCFSKDAIKFSASKVIDQNNDGVKFDFMYLDKGDGAVINVIHTPFDHVYCHGNIIDCKPIANMGEYSRHKPKLGPYLVLLIVLGLVLLFSVIRPLVDNTIDKYWEIFFNSLSLVIPTLFMSFILVGWIILSYYKYNKFPSWSRKLTAIKTYKPINIIGYVRAKCNNCNRTFNMPKEEFYSIVDSRKAYCPYCRKAELTYIYDEI